MATQATEIAKGVPALAAERAVTWPKRTRARLANGLEVVLAEAHSIPKFHGELYFRAGNAQVSDRSTGLAEMTATLVRTGTAQRASRQIEEDLRRLEREKYSGPESKIEETHFRIVPVANGPYRGNRGTYRLECVQVIPK